MARRRRKQEPIDREEARRLYLELGSFAEVARRLGYTSAAVRECLHRHGVATRRPDRARRGEAWRKLSSIWRSMRARCRNPRDPLYARYGACGVDVGEEWQSFEPFYEWARGAGYRPGMNIELVDPARDFSPANCRWITSRQRMRRDGFPGGSGGRSVTAFGETKSVAAWADDPRCRVGAAGLARRLDRGFSPVDAITLPKGAALGGSENLEPPAKRKLIDWERAERLFARGMSYADVARRIGAGYFTVRKGLIARGCERRLSARLTGEHGRPLYKAWTRMRQSTTNPRDAGYATAGARGVRVCRGWDSFDAFHAWALESGYRPGLVLMRLRADGDYSARNCRWVTPRELGRRVHEGREHPAEWTITAFGETKGPTAWSRDRRCNVSLTTLIKRIDAGMTPDLALTLPARHRGRRDTPTRLIPAFGMERSLTEWASDSRCKVSADTISERLRKGIPAEVAITAPPYRCPLPEET